MAKQNEEKKDESVGFRIKEIRIQHGQSQREFARILGISQSFLSEVEQDNQSPNLGMLFALRKYYSMDLNWLVMGEDDEENKNKSNLPDHENQQFYDNEILQILEYLQKSPKTKSFMLTFIQARGGDLSAITEMKNIIKYWDMMVD